MAWEQRGERRYYYRSRRAGSRVIRKYVGTGLAGLLAEREDQERRQLRTIARDCLAGADDPAFTAAATAHQALDRFADTLMRATLATAGYHQPNRSAWRRRRDHRFDTDDA